MAVREMSQPIKVATGVQGDWPAEVDFILSAMEAASGDFADRRNAARVPFRAVATLRLYSDEPGALPWQLYTRDVSPRSLGFVTRHRLPLGYGGVLELPLPGGQTARLDVTLLRCRQSVQGWFDGALYFNREQWCFSPDELEQTQGDGSR